MAEREPDPATQELEATTGLRASVSLLRRNRDFRRLFLASVISLGGDWFLFVAITSLIVETTGRRDRRGPRDPRPGTRVLHRLAPGRRARRPARPAEADDRLRPRAGRRVRLVPVRRLGDRVARLPAARAAVGLRRAVRPRVDGGDPEPGGTPRPADRERAERLALGHDARGRGRPRRRRGHRVRTRHGVRDRCCVVRRLGPVALGHPPAVLRAARAGPRAPEDARRHDRGAAVRPRAITGCSP